jgi:hypothetical protein
MMENDDIMAAPSTMDHNKLNMKQANNQQKKNSCCG